jgi:hypothetical protein
MSTSDVWTVLGVALTALGVIVAILVSVIPYIWRLMQFQRLQQEELLHRESHNLKLFEALSSNNHRLQLAAAAVLAERLASNPRRDAEAEHRVIIRALLAVTKRMGTAADDPIVPAPIAKLIADGVVKNQRIPLQQFDWQNTRLTGAWWEGVNVSGIDFWQADLSWAGMKEANFRKSVLVEAKLDGSVLVGADLTNARLERASLLGTDLREAKVEGARFAGAIYNDRTRFPEGFSPDIHGLIKDHGKD